MVCEVYAEGSEALEIKILNISRSGLQDDLILMVFVETIGIVPVSTVSRPARRHHIGHSIGLRSQDPQEGLGSHRAGSHFHVVGLLQHTPLPVPELLQCEDYSLKVLGAHRKRRCLFPRRRLHELKTSPATNYTNSAKLFRVIREIRGKSFRRQLSPQGTYETNALPKYMIS